MGKRIYVRSGGNWVDVTTPSGSDADITAVVAGTGLTGGASSGSATLNVDTSTIATRAYVAEIAAGINWHAGVDYATAAVLPNSPTYTAGTADASDGYGIGATLAGTTNGRLEVDGTLVSTGERVLVKNQSDAKHNGIYIVTTQGSGAATWLLTRALDANNSVPGQVASGDAVYVYPAAGSINKSQGFILSSFGTSTSHWSAHIIGTDNIVWSQFTGLSGITTGSGLSKSANTINVDYGDGLKLDVNDAVAVDLDSTISSTSTTKAATASAVKQAYDLAFSANTTADAAVAKSVLGGKGSIVAASASSTPVGLAVGSNNQILIANSAEGAGLQWITSPYATSANPVVTGKIIVDNNAGSPAALGTYNSTTVIQGVSADGADTNIVLDAHGTGFYPHFIARATRGTAASPTATQNSDIIGEIGFHGYGATGFATSTTGAIRAVATENFTDLVNGGNIQILVVPNAGASLAVGLTISDTAVNIPTGSTFKINGTSVLSSTTLGSNVISSSLTSVGTIGTGTWQGSAVGIAYGGTGQTTATGAVNALLPSQASNSGKLLTTDGTNVSWYTLSIANETIDGGSA